MEVVHFAKILVETGETCGLDRTHYEAEITKLAKAARGGVRRSSVDPRRDPDRKRQGAVQGCRDGTETQTSAARLREAKEGRKRSGG